ncbi:MAG: hypothetical protein IPL35_04640 [Sphingobacteriales bacterium]|nr:hypothetical protein [Sphingobacteriales bacterium]
MPLRISANKYQIPLINPDEIPNGRKPTNFLSQTHTIGIFQFESPGMQKYLRDLKLQQYRRPHRHERLPHRPAPMEFIFHQPQAFGRETVEYPHFWAFEELLQTHPWNSGIL